VKACGKLPASRPRCGSYSSDSRPTSFEHPARVVATSEEYEVVGEPERAREERALPRRETVDSLGRRGMVAAHEAVDEELALDRGDRAADARVGRGKEADERDHEPSA